MKHHNRVSNNNNNCINSSNPDIILLNLSIILVRQIMLTISHLQIFMDMHNKKMNNLKKDMNNPRIVKYLLTSIDTKKKSLIRPSMIDSSKRLLIMTISLRAMTGMIIEEEIKVEKIHVNHLTNSEILACLKVLNNQNYMTRTELQKYLWLH